jgi:hypothetical protein
MAGNEQIQGSSNLRSKCDLVFELCVDHQQIIEKDQQPKGNDKY